MEDRIKPSEFWRLIPPIGDVESLKKFGIELDGLPPDAEMRKKIRRQRCKEYSERRRGNEY